MPYALRDFGCPDCYVIVQRRAPAGAVVRCLECAVKHAVAYEVQMRRKQGPLYDEWLARMISWAACAAPCRPPAE